MKTRILLSLLLALTLALSITPAFAQPLQQRGDGLCLGGNTTVESGETRDSLFVVGCNASIRSGGTVQKDVAVFGGNLNLDNGGRVNGDIAVFGGNLNIGGQVQGDVAIMGGAVQLASTAVVNGSVRVVGGSLNRAEGATISGGISNEKGFHFGPYVNPVVSPINNMDLVGGGVLRGLLTSLALAALGVLLVVFFPKATGRVKETAENSFGPSLGVGCLTLVAFVILIVPVSIVTLLIGGIVLSLALLAAGIFGWIAVGYLAGERILEALRVREIAPVLAVLVGVILLAIIGEVPCLGWLLALIIETAGIGAVILSRFGTRSYRYGGGGGMVPAYPSGPLPPAPYKPGPPAEPTAYGGPALNPPGIEPPGPASGELGAGK